MKRLTALLAVTVGLAACGSDEPRPTTSELERQIQTQFEKAAENAAGYLKIKGVRCVRKSPGEARCRVEGEEQDALGLYAPSTVDLIVDIDPESGSFQWTESER